MGSDVSFHYPTWGMSWGGSWGGSWGPIEVYEWDTTQGMAQPNLRFEPIREVEVRVSRTTAVVKTTTALRGTGAAAAAGFRDSTVMYVRAPSAIGVANAFVRVARHGARVEFRGAGCAANGFAHTDRTTCGVSTRCTPARGEAVAAAKLGYAGSSAYGAPAKGVKNPTDAQLATLAYTLVRNSLTTRQKRDYM